MQIKYPRRQEQTHDQKAQRFGLCDPEFDYTPAAATDVRRTWMKFGWRPVHEQFVPNEESKDEVA